MNLQDIANRRSNFPGRRFFAPDSGCLRFEGAWNETASPRYAAGPFGFDDSGAGQSQFSGGDGGFTQIGPFAKSMEPKEPRVRSEEEQTRRERAKVANRIFRSVCLDSGMESCFFTDFSSWSEYVEGKMSESEFSEIARHEVEKMRAEMN